MLFDTLNANCNTFYNDIPLDTLKDAVIEASKNGKYAVCISSGSSVDAAIYFASIHGLQIKSIQDKIFLCWAPKNLTF
jgi:hypothetical protein